MGNKGMLSKGVNINIEDDQFSLKVTREKGCGAYTAEYMSLKGVDEDGEIVDKKGELIVERGITMDEVIAFIYGVLKGHDAMAQIELASITGEMTEEALKGLEFLMESVNGMEEATEIASGREYKDLSLNGDQDVIDFTKLTRNKDDTLH